MKTGIYLGPPIGRMRTLGRVLVVVGVLGTLIHAGVFWRESRELAAVRADVERREATGARISAELDADARAVLTRLGAVTRSKVPSAITATELLQMIAVALPDDVAIVGVALEASSATPSLVLDAVARREEDVTALERRMAASDRVTATKLLGERRAADGTLSVRLQVELRP